MPEPRFTALIELYERNENEARRSLGARERERLDLLGRVAALEERRRQAAEESRFEMRQQLGRYWAQIGIELQTFAKALGTCDEAIVAARAALVEAHRQIATFAKLRERDALVERRRVERRDARRLDELAGARHCDTHPGQEASA
jgi:flagellar export protein FliJ